MGSRGMRGGEGSLGQVREPVPAPLRGRSWGRRGGRCGLWGPRGVRCSSCERDPPPRSSMEGQLSSEGSLFLPVLSPSRSLPSPRGGERAGIPCESREVAAAGGAPCDAASHPAKLWGKGLGALSPSPAAAQVKSNRGGSHGHDVAAGFPRPLPPCRGSLGCAAPGSLGRWRPAAGSADRSRQCSLPVGSAPRCRAGSRLRAGMRLGRVGAALPGKVRQGRGTPRWGAAGKWRPERGGGAAGRAGSEASSHSAAGDPLGTARWSSASSPRPAAPGAGERCAVQGSGCRVTACVRGAAGFVRLSFTAPTLGEKPTAPPWSECFGVLSPRGCARPPSHQGQAAGKESSERCGGRKLGLWSCCQAGAGQRWQSPQGPAGQARRGELPQSHLFLRCFPGCFTRSGSWPERLKCVLWMVEWDTGTSHHSKEQ